MPVVSCPHCNTDLEIDAGDYGYRMQCPACQSAFTPERPDARAASPPPPPPAAPPPEPGTKVVTCTECRGQVSVAVEDVGHSMQCPLCDKVFVATDPDRPPRGSGRGSDRGGRDDRPSLRRGSDRNSGMPRYDEYDDRPSRRSARYDDDDDRPRRRRGRYDDDDSPRELVEYAQRECGPPGTGMIVTGVVDILLGVLRIGIGVLGGMGGGARGEDEVVMLILVGYGVWSLAIGGFLIYAGTQMREAKRYTLCMTGSILSLIPVVDPCCLLGLIFGIMGVTKLNESRVKQGFDANRPGEDPDAYN